MLTIEKEGTSKVLRNMSVPLKKSEIKKYAKLWKEMVKYIKNPVNKWVGLAAPQVGYNIRMVVVSLLKDRDDENFSTVLMINPEIIEHGDELEWENEWCLSVDGVNGVVERWKDIKLQYWDEKWNTKTLRLSWVSARIVQHEIDHIDGVLFIDKVKK